MFKKTQKKNKREKNEKRKENFRNRDYIMFSLLNIYYLIFTLHLHIIRDNPF